MKDAKLLMGLLALVLAGACGGSGPATEHEHEHSHGSEADPSHEAPSGEEDDHEHAEEPLGTLALGGQTLTLAQGHGGVRAGGESHLVVQLSEDDGGATVVRGWLGTEDRTLSYVGKGRYAASHGDYDLDVEVPDPLPEDTRWWIELELPNGDTLLGSIEPLKD